MNAPALADLVDMDGYAFYVWGSFVMAAAAASWEAVMLVQRRRRALEDLHERQRLQAVANAAPGDAGHAA
jgi:heme exporter protein CcmD